MLDQLAAHELLTKQSPLVKAIEEIGEKIDKAEKTCKKLMILTWKSKILEEKLQNEFKLCMGETLKEQ